jgi:hypothetical protein
MAVFFHGTSHLTSAKLNDPPMVMRKVRRPVAHVFFFVIILLLQAVFCIDELADENCPVSGLRLDKLFRRERESR